MAPTATAWVSNSNKWGAVIEAERCNDCLKMWVRKRFTGHLVPEGINIIGIIGKNGFRDPLQQKEGQRHHLKGTVRVHLNSNHINNLISGRNMDAEIVKVNYLTALCTMTIFFLLTKLAWISLLQMHKSWNCLVCNLMPETPIHGRLGQKDQHDF